MGLTFNLESGRFNMVDTVREPTIAPARCHHDSGHRSHVRLGYGSVQQVHNT